MTVAETFQAMVGLFNPAAASGLNKTFQWNITGDQAGIYALRVADGTCTFVEGGVEKPDVVFTMKDQDWLSLAEGKLDPQSAFFSGKLKVTGDIGLALRLQQIFPTPR
jgi:putative sterol carrier protein